MTPATREAPSAAARAVRVTLIVLTLTLSWVAAACWTELYDDHYVQHRAGNSAYE